MNLTQIAELIQPHEEYKAWATSLEMYRDLYAGGAQMKAKASSYLYRRHREPGEVYQERLSRAYYENHIGSIVDWYASTLFRREPVLTVEDTSRRSCKFYCEFIDDCDRNGLSITDFFRKRFIEALIFGRSFVALEFPKVQERPSSRLEEEAIGADRGYLTSLHPLDVVNWKRAADGRLTKLVARIENSEELTPAGRQPGGERYLIYSESEVSVR